MLSACFPGRPRTWSAKSRSSLVKASECKDRASLSFEVDRKLEKPGKRLADDDDVAVDRQRQRSRSAAVIEDPKSIMSFRLHVGSKQTDEDCAYEREELRRALEGEAHYEQFKDAVDEGVLRRFLTARDNDVDKAKAMLLVALRWRAERMPFRHNYAELERQHSYGCMRVAGKDRWGRPVVVLDNSADRCTDVGIQMRCLAFVLEHALRIMEPPVEKYAVFIHLSNFSILNNPPMASTRETCAMVTTCFPECCGTVVLHNAPRVFAAAFAAARPFIDNHTLSKMHFTVGDDSPGTANDAKLQYLFGPNWRELTGARQPKESSKSSPGYVHRKCWRRVLVEECEWRRRRGNKGTLRHELTNWPGGNPDQVPENPCLVHPEEDDATPSMHAESFPADHGEARALKAEKLGEATSTSDGRPTSMWMMLLCLVLVATVLLLLRQVQLLQTELEHFRRR
mmetsp:Transcript_38871/g.91509  ORF Transcript_38871/g.91509 Transcript_38871/m.91509 type:complete len:454 (+) Transcript_38871:124-1485(+)